MIIGRVDICKIKWSFEEVFWKSSSPSTVPVQQRTPGNLRNIPGYGQSFPTSLELEPYLLGAYSTNKVTWKQARKEVGNSSLNA